MSRKLAEEGEYSVLTLGSLPCYESEKEEKMAIKELMLKISTYTYLYDLTRKKNTHTHLYLFLHKSNMV